MATQQINKFLKGGFSERAFQDWYKKWADKTGIDTDPDNPLHKYDYRAAFRAGAKPSIDPEDNKWHWPSPFKHIDHPNRFVDGIDTITGEPTPWVRPRDEGPYVPRMPLGAAHMRPMIGSLGGVLGRLGTMSKRKRRK